MGEVEQEWVRVFYIMTKKGTVADLKECINRCFSKVL